MPLFNADKVCVICWNYTWCVINRFDCLLLLIIGEYNMYAGIWIISPIVLFHIKPVCVIRIIFATVTAVIDHSCDQICNTYSASLLSWNYCFFHFYNSFCPVKRFNMFEDLFHYLFIRLKKTFFPVFVVGKMIQINSTSFRSYFEKTQNCHFKNFAITFLF